MFTDKLTIQFTRYCSKTSRPDHRRDSTIRSEINKYINYMFNKGELSEEWKEYLFIKIDLSFNYL